MRIDSIDPDEQVVITFDFSAALDAGETLSGSIATSVTAVLGNDAAPAAILNGVAACDNTSTRVLQPVKGGLPDHDYAIKVVCVTSNPQKVLALVAHLPIRQAV